MINSADDDGDDDDDDDDDDYEDDYDYDDDGHSVAVIIVRKIEPIANLCPNSIYRYFEKYLAQTVITFSLSRGLDDRWGIDMSRTYNWCLFIVVLRNTLHGQL